MARNLSTYLDHIKVHSKSTQRLFRAAYRSFAGIEEFIGSGPGNDDIYDYLQKWINGSKRNPVTTRAYFSMIKLYLHYRSIKLDSTDIRQCLNFPARHEEEMYPLEIDEFRRILEKCGRKRKAMYLAQASSGMRIGEMVQLRREHLHTDTDRIMVKIPARITKKKRARTTFFSAEAAGFLMPRLGWLDGRDLVFGTNPNPVTARGVEISHLALTLERAGLDRKYETNGRNVITTHSFRAFFITKVSREDANLAKYFAGQKGYLMQYDRLSDKEKLEHYIGFEPSLLVYGQAGGMGGTPEWNGTARVTDLEKACRRMEKRMDAMEERIVGLLDPDTARRKDDKGRADMSKP